METRSCKRTLDNDDAEYISINDSDDSISINDNDDAISINDNEQPTKKRKIDSNDEWNAPRILDGKYFQLLSRSGENISVRCTECNEIKKGSIKSTGNFKTHYRIKHIGLFESLNIYLKQKSDKSPMKQPTLEKFTSFTNPEQVK